MAAKRKVNFNQTVTVHEILSINDYTALEITAAWYDANEMEKITERCLKILCKIESGKSKSGKQYCVRGLEGHTTQGSIIKKSNRSAAYIAVLDEQDRCRNEAREIRVQAISDAYRRTSSSCQMWAQVVGNRDQQAVEEYLYSEDVEDDFRAEERKGNVLLKHVKSSLKSSNPGSEVGSHLANPLVGPFRVTAHAA